MLLTLRGTPFLYAGEELGLEDATIAPEAARDPGGRDGCRAPFPWTAAPDRGWAGHPWLPWPPEPGVHNAETEVDDPTSMLHLYRALLAARRQSAALTTGSLELLGGDSGSDLPEGVLGYLRLSTEGNDLRLVLVNFTDRAVAVTLPAPRSVPMMLEVSSDSPADPDTDPVPFPGRLEPHQAVLLRPR
jgi:alpha-glucosidase